MFSNNYTYVPDKDLDEKLKQIIQQGPKENRSYKEVPDILLDYISSKSTAGGLVVPVSDNNIVELHEQGEMIIRSAYAEGPIQEKALKYWKANNRTGIFGLPIKFTRLFWSEKI
jgi:hypothetical protein